MKYAWCNKYGLVSHPLIIKRHFTRLLPVTTYAPLNLEVIRNTFYDAVAQRRERGLLRQRSSIMEFKVGDWIRVYRERSANLPKHA